jgi:putative lipoic acid-binding regulatory protein
VAIQPDCHGFLFMDSSWFNSFQEKLDKHYAWPALYMFKFIVPLNKQEELRQLFPLHITSTEKHSEKGNYISLTYQMMMPSSESVIEVYRKVSVIDGIIAL